jgi:hypothetical protein
MEISKACARWYSTNLTGKDYEEAILKLTKSFRVYEKNIFILNRKALLI